MFLHTQTKWMDLDYEIPELDLIHISHECASWMTELPEIQWMVLIIKINSSSLVTASKMFHIAAPRCHSKHPLSCHNWYVMLFGQRHNFTMGRWHMHWYQTITWPTKSRLYENIDILPQTLDISTHNRIIELSNEH